MAVLSIRQAVSTLPVDGYGYIAGEAPDGIVTLDNVPGRAEVDLLRRSDHAWLRREYSRDDGTYRFDGLPLGVEYDVIGRDPTNVWDDVIVSRVQPYAPPQITTALPAFPLGAPVGLQLEVQYGAAPFAFAATALPPGLALSETGYLSGATTTQGSTPTTITAIDAYGAVASRDYVIVVT